MANFPYEAKKYIPGLGKDVLVQPDEVSFTVAHQAHSTAADVATLVADFNALLDKLVAAGIMKAQ